MKKYVLDASVVLKWFLREEGRGVEVAGKLQKLSRETKVDLVAPEWLKLEVVNVLVKKYDFEVQDIEKVLAILEEAGVRFCRLSDELLLLAVRLARKFSLSLYDGLYVAVAESMGVELVSADEKGHGRLKNVVLLKDWKL